MSQVSIEVPDDLLGILGEFDRPVNQAALELVVLELYRRGRIASGRAAELLGTPRSSFIQRASELGIPYLRVDEQDLNRELELGRSL